MVLNANGILALYRDETLLEGTTLSPLGGDWHSLTLSTIGDIVRVNVDDVTLLAVQDATPLPAGGLSIASVDGSPLRIDDFVLAIPAVEAITQAMVLPTETSLPVFTPIPSDSEFQAMNNRSALYQQQLLQTTAEFDIPNGREDELISKIQANCNSTNDVVVLNLLGGTYELTSGQDFVWQSFNFGKTGLPPIKCHLTINGDGDSNGTGSTITRNPTSPAFRIIAIDESASLTLNDVTISNGLLNKDEGFDGGDNGAGILSIRSTLNLNRSTVENNTIDYFSDFAIRGAGINVFQGEVNIQDSILQNNMNNGDGNGPVRGGGIAIDGNLGGVITHIISGTTIQGNVARDGGSGIYVEFNQFVPLTISRSLIQNNTSSNGVGGGIRTDLKGVVSITNSLIQNNDATDGDAIFMHSTDSIVTIHDSCILGNLNTLPSVDIFNASATEMGATRNWWGDVGGPGAGTADTVSSNVDSENYVDWLPDVPDDCYEGLPEPPTCTGIVDLAQGNPTVNIRQGPGTSYTLIGTAVHGEPISILGTHYNENDENSPWLEVDFLNREFTGWIYDDAIDVDDTCVEIPITDENGEPIQPTFDYELPAPNWSPPPCDDTGITENWQNCAKIVYGVFYEEFQLLTGRKPTIVDVLAAVYANELSVVRASGLNGINERNGVDANVLAFEALHGNYWAVVTETTGGCSDAQSCTLSATQLTENYLVQVQSWYSLANFGNITGQMRRGIRDNLIRSTLQYRPLAFNAISSQAIIGAHTPWQWGNYGLGKLRYSDANIFFDVATNKFPTVYCVTVREFSEENNDYDISMSPDRWRDYRFVLITVRSIGQTSTYDNTVRPQWVDNSGYVRRVDPNAEDERFGRDFLDCLNDDSYVPES